MDEKNWQNIKEFFLAALEKDKVERADFLEDVYEKNPDLREEIESLLVTHEEIEDFIEAPAFQIENIFPHDADQPERHFGNYKIIREIGAGGMGAVFLAERDDGEFTQQLAIKIVRQTIAESEIINRFKRERQILASLNHPNIAKLLDGGVSVDGQPFLAMEFVDGEAITKFASRENLDLEARLKLFLKVCAAVAYAHRNLIVHRDLKPGNILVTDDGEPKLLDFGLAKLIETNLLNDAEQTQTAFRALTPAYASPEQLKNEPITTASDIYSLGIVFYELLTGERPFHFEGKSLEEIIKTVSNTEPFVPSFKKEREKGRKGEREKINDNKAFSPSPLLPFSLSQIKGDLDNITLKALRKEPERRYQSVEAFADDIEKYLKGLPVSARPDTFKYRAGKFIKRHKVGVAATILILLSLVGGIIATIRQARIAEREKVKAEVINKFLQNMLGYSDNSVNLSRPKGNDMTVNDVLDEASKRLETADLSGQSEIKAELLRIIGSSYLTQGNYESAAKNLQAALDLQIQIYGEESPETLQTFVDLGQVFVVTADFPNAEKIYRQRLSILERANEKGTINPTYLLVALNDYAVLQRAQGDSQKARAILLEALALKPQIPPENRIAVGIVESVYALTLSDEGKFDEAENIVRARIAEIRGQPNSETLELASNLNGLGNFLMEKGELDESLQNLLEAEKTYRKLADKSFLPLGDNLRYQAQVLYLQGDFAEAEEKISETLKIYRENARPQFINYPTALTVQGLIFNKTNRTAEAEKILREAVELREKNLPKEHFLSALTNGALGECLMTQKKYAEAEPFLTDSFESLKTSQGADNPRTETARLRLILLYETLKKFDLANKYRKKG